MNSEAASKIISLMDLTSLNQDDTQDTVRLLCEKAVTPYGAVAAVCIYPQYVKTAVSALAGTDVKVATVANFPYGTESLSDTLAEINQALADGADEIDVVIPYQHYSDGARLETQNRVKAYKETCQGAILKVILETGALQKPELIALASRDVLEAGADFLKTSTGKIATGATLEAANVMLREVDQYYRNTGKLAGFKASGGIKTVNQALDYLKLAEKIMGKDYIAAEHFRFGASSLLTTVLAAIE